MRKVLLLLLPLLLLPALEGCTALSKISTSLQPASNPIVQAGIDLAVGAAVGTGPLAKVKAMAIKAIAVQVAADAANPAVTITALESTLNAKIVALSPSPADTAAFMILTQTLQAFLNGKIQSSGAITATTSVAIAGLANAVITACSFYGA